MAEKGETETGDDRLVARTAAGRCPRCGQLWPKSAPRCLGCDHYDPARRGGQVKLGNAVVFGVAVLVGLAFVVVHGRRRQAEHPPMVTPKTAAAGEQDYIAKPPPEPPPNVPHRTRSCGFTQPELAAFAAPYLKNTSVCATTDQSLHLRLVFELDGKTTATHLSGPAGSESCASLLLPLHVEVPAGRNGVTGPMDCILKL